MFQRVFVCWGHVAAIINSFECTRDVDEVRPGMPNRSVSNESVWYVFCTPCMAVPESASATRIMTVTNGERCAAVNTTGPDASKAPVHKIAEAACSTRSGLAEPGVIFA